MTIRFRRLPVVVSIFVGLSLATAGCGPRGDRPELGQVEGTVTLDGKPLPGATVTFRPEKGKSSQGVTSAEGHYELIYLRDIKGAVVGPHTVAITTVTEVSPKEKLPARYNRRSELKREVEAGDNTFDFELESK